MITFSRALAFHNTFHGFKVLKKVKITKMFNVDFYDQFIEFGLFYFFLLFFILLDLIYLFTYIYIYIIWNNWQGFSV